MPNFKDDPLKKVLENKVIDLSGKQPDSRHVGIIICALVCELSELSAIVSNRLLNMITDKVWVERNITHCCQFYSHSKFLDHGNRRTSKKPADGKMSIMS